ncbi:substrate-binding periplasmic protein [Chitinibacteraceae bacterium HSL-7]
MRHGAHKLIAAAVALCCAAAAFAAPKDITLSLQDYPPFMGETLPHRGLMTAVISAAFKQAGIPVKLTPTPNNRAIEGARHGWYDGSFGWAKNPEREADLYYSQPVMSLRMVFCHRAGLSYPWQSLADLSRWRIGITEGNYYSDAFSNLVAKGVLTVDRASSDVQTLRKLVAGRVDLVPIDAEVGPYVLSSKQFSAAERAQVSCQSRAYWEAPLHVVISRTRADGPELIRKFDAALAQMRASGEFDRIVERARADINRR